MTIKITDGGVRVGERPAIKFNDTDARYLARVLKSMHEAGRDATPSTVMVAAGKPVTVEPGPDNTLILSKGRARVVLSGQESGWIVKAFNGI
ncbi:hypothetical protein ACWDTP_04575 [Mycobacterium sp. NPDC003449]